MIATITFEHATSTWMLVTGLVAAIVLAGFWFWRYLSVRGADLGLLALRIGFLLLLGWCLLRPSTKVVEKSLLRPRLAVLVDDSTSMLRSPKEGIPTRWSVAKEILGAHWVKNLSGKAEIEGYAFASEVGTKSAPADLGKLTPNGNSTRLHDALKTMIKRYRGQPLAGILLLSDGIDTREPDEGWAKASWPCPIFAVRLEPPVEAEEIPPDVHVTKVDTSRRVVVGWESKLTAIVSGQGTKGEALNVQLLENGTVIQELPTQLPADGASREVAFQIQHPAVGSFTYTVTIPPLPGEAITNDNSYAIAVQVVDTKNRLLYVEGIPRFESKFLTRALQANQNISPLVFLQGPNHQFLTVGQRGSMTTDLTAEQLAQVKIVIVGDFDAEALGEARASALVKFVEDGGSLVLLGGPKAWGKDGFAGTALTKLMPAHRPTALPAKEGRFPVRLTAEGRAHPAFATESTAWENAPPVLSVFPGCELAPGAATLVETTTGDPIVVAQRFGQGKVAALLTDSLWRWQLEPGKSEAFARFWNQMIEWLKPAEHELQPYELDLFADTDQLFLGDKIALRARIGGREEVKPGGLTVTCEIRSAAENRTLSFPMVEQPVTTATGKTYPGFGLEFTAQVAGMHTAVAVVEIDGKKVQSGEYSFFVKAFTPENSPQLAQHHLLEALAAASGGRYGEPTDIEAALTKMDLTGRTEERSVYSTLWNSWLVLACLVGLLTVEWSVRKMRNLAIWLLLLLPLQTWADKNLVPNGSFNDPAEALAHWQYKYDQAGESWYADNHNLVSVLKQEGDRQSVLRLNVATQFLADNPGVKVDSFPIPIKPGGKYRFSAWARTTGPNCRIMLEGYKWRPDTKPHPNPTLYEVRRCYRFAQIYFGEVKGGTAGGVGAQWKKASMEFPEGKMGTEGQQAFNEIQFLVVHVVGIQGTKGDLYVDDISLERLN